MPKESVTPSDNMLPTVQVGWSREATDSVQLALQSPEWADGQHHIIDLWYGSEPTRTQIAEQLLERLGSGGELADAIARFHNAKTSDEANLAKLHIGRQVLDSVTASSWEVGTAWATHLDRPAINRLVVLLRKARTAVFGKDE